MEARRLLIFIFALLGLSFVENTAGQSGNGKVTRYWDCCKPSCAWRDNVNLKAGSKPVVSCRKDDGHLRGDENAKCAKDGGPVHTCSKQTPWKKNDNLSYGFAAARLIGQGSAKKLCCSCFELTFTSEAVKGKKMIVQVTNTGDDLHENHFDIAMPGGGVGAFDCCTSQFGRAWGERYGGVKSRGECDQLPPKLKAGCFWRFDWFKNANNPTVSFKPIGCPREIVLKTGCRRA